MNTQILRDFQKDIDKEGFDLQAGQTWIYPTNYPVRDYQFNIVSECLYKNTLVSLPTGLGKTFIAAVVMFNFYRWYPSGKIMFMAPTKPLVKQQMEACYNIMAIPKDVTAELTGTKAQSSRKEVWIHKRVFFITPQVLQNDLSVITELGEKIKCIVIDEAHKAKGNHAYCEVLHQISAVNKHFRVLALSATPGNTMNDVSEIVNNLLISHLELRTDDSPDVMPYIYERKVEKFVVPLGEKIQMVKNAFLKILERYTDLLLRHGVIHGNCANLSKGQIYMCRKEFQEKNKHAKVKAYGEIMRNLNICSTLYHGYELLIKHGLRQFLKYFEEHSGQVLLRGNMELENILVDVREYLGPPACTDILPDGTVPKLSPSTKFGHPKFYKLLELLLTYFSNENNTSSKVIIFTEYKDSVQEIFGLLIHQTPTIRPKTFMGQSSITQKKQIMALNSFRSGECNTLISTCIGEEGLDIGEVDLIVIFDMPNKSQVRMVQRMGRTGRRKEGKIIVLVTEGKEEEIFKECMTNKHYISKTISKWKNLQVNFFQHNPRMIPDSLVPTCQKINISVPTISRTKKGNIKDMLNSLTCNSKHKTPDFLFDDVEIIETKDRIVETSMLWEKGENMMDIQQYNDKILFSKRVESLRVSQPTSIIGHSKNCDILTSLLQFADSKRYNIPITQKRVNEMPSIANKKSKFGRHGSSDNFKQSDIRSMFLKSQPTQGNNTENIKELVNDDLLKCYTNDLINELHSEISTYLSLSCIEESNCKICDNLFICYRTIKKDCDIKLDSWVQPDLAILDELNLANILSFEKKQSKLVEIEMFDNSAIFAQFTNKDWNEFNNSFNTTLPFEAPESAKKVLNMTRVDNYGANAELKISPQSENVLTFFKLDDINNLFIGQCDNKEQDAEILIKNVDTPSASPEFSIKSTHSNTSPILGTIRSCVKGVKNVNKKLFSNKDKLHTINEVSSPDPLKSTPNKSKPNLSKLNQTKKSNFFKSSKESLLTDNDCDVKHKIELDDANSNSTSNCVTQLFTNISDFCDMSIFGLDISEITSKNTACSKNAVDCKETNSGSDDLFDSCNNSPQLNDENMLCTFNDFSSDIITSPLKTKADVDADQLSPVLASGVKLSQRKTTIDTWVDKPSTNNLNVREQLSPILGSNKILQSQKCDSIKGESFSSADVCDLSVFGLSNINLVRDSNNIDNSSKLNDFNLKDFESSFKPLLDSNSNENVCLEKSIINNKTKGEEPQEDDSSQVSITQILKIVNGTQANSVTKAQSMKAFGLATTNLDIARDSKVNESFSKLDDINLKDLQSPSKPRFNKCLKENIEKPPIGSNTTIINKRQERQENDSPQVSISQMVNIVNATPKNGDLKTQSNKVLPVVTNKNRKCTISLTHDGSREDFKENTIKSEPLRHQKTSFIKRHNGPKRKRSITSVQYNSEDEFEESPFKNNGWISVKKKSEPSSSKKTEAPPKVPSKKKKRKRVPKNLIDDEAALTSSDESAFGDSHSEAGSSDDVFESSFVNDKTQDIANTTVMHAKYLQTTRSPLRGTGKFKIPAPPPLNKEIFSQEVDYGNETYMNDTFCVDDDMELSQNCDLSNLEIAEMLLNQKRKAKNGTDSNTKKKRRVIVLSSDSD